MPSLPGYTYVAADAQLYVNLYIGSQMQHAVNGVDVQLRQETNYPWDGQVKLTLNPAQATAFTLSLRVPGWVKGQPVPSDLYRYLDDTPGCVVVRINGEPVAVNEMAGYIHLERTWQAGDTVELVLPMPIRRVVAHPAVTDATGKVALERGPIVYAVEAIDNDGPVADITLPDDLALIADHRQELLNGVTVITGADFMAIPYYAWSHRGASEMAVWISRDR
ncbi:hypothetical protein ACFLYO_09340 [Chloroflexota bacterium]